MTTDREVQGPPRTPRAPWWLLALCIAAITHGSLSPWRFALPATPLLPTLRYYAWEQALPWPGWPDVAGNVLMFVPLAALGLRVTGRRAEAGWRGVAPTLLLGAVFAFVLQLLQVFVPGRHASMADVGWNLVGLMIGAAIGLVHRRLPHMPRTNERVSGAPFAGSVVMLWLLLQWRYVPLSIDRPLDVPALAVLMRPTWEQLLDVDVVTALGVAVCAVALRGMGRSFAALLGLVALGMLGRLLETGGGLSAARLDGGLLGLALALLLQAVPRHLAARLLLGPVALWAIVVVAEHARFPLGAVRAWLPVPFWIGASLLLVWHSRRPPEPPMR